MEFTEYQLEFLAQMFELTSHVTEFTDVLPESELTMTRIYIDDDNDPTN